MMREDGMMRIRSTIRDDSGGIIIELRFTTLFEGKAVIAVESCEKPMPMRSKFGMVYHRLVRCDRPNGGSFLNTVSSLN